MTRDGIDNRTAPARVYGSTLYSVGLSFRPGRLAFLQPRTQRRGPTPIQAEGALATSSESPEQQTQLRLLALREAALTAEIIRAETTGDSLLAARLRLEREQLRMQMLSAGTPEAQAAARPVITLPAPEQGELYVRYGPGVSALAGAASQQPPQAPALGSPELALLEQRLMARLDALERDRQELSRLEQRLARLEALLTQGTPTAVSVRTDTTVTLRTQPSTATRQLGWQGIGFVAGVNALVSPRQFLLGVRGDYGALLGGRLRLWPEAILSFGGGTSGYNLNVNATTPLPALPTLPFLGSLEFDADPYIGLGLGLLAFSNPPRGVAGIQTTWNLILGAERAYGPGILFAEYVSMNFFSFNRLQIGYRFLF
jgi:hypothetical protein